MGGMSEILLFAARNRVLAALILVTITGVLATGLPKLRIDTRLELLLDRDGPKYELYLEAIEAFGSDNTTVFFIRDAKLFTPEKLEILQAMADELDALDSSVRDGEGTVTFVVEHLNERLGDVFVPIEQVGDHLGAVGAYDRRVAPIVEGQVDDPLQRHRPVQLRRPPLEASLLFHGVCASRRPTCLSRPSAGAGLLQVTSNACGPHLRSIFPVTIATTVFFNSFKLENVALTAVGS